MKKKEKSLVQKSHMKIGAGILPAGANQVSTAPDNFLQIAQPSYKRLNEQWVLFLALFGILRVAKVDRISDTRHGAAHRCWQACLHNGADVSTSPAKGLRRRRVRARV